MNFNNLKELKKDGFTGFVTMKDLSLNSSLIPNVRGIYLVLNVINDGPEYLPTGTGGFFKGKNPNISVDILKANWVENVIVLYIGKAGSEGSNATLRSRLKQYLQFGQGKNIGHWGGRLIWQLSHSNELMICWKTLPNEEPRSVEQKLIEDFLNQFGRWPFANLTG